MNRIKLCSASYGRTHYQTSDNSIYICLKRIKEITKNEEMFFKTISFQISHEYLHHLLLKQFGEKTCGQLDNLFEKAQLFSTTEYSFNEYLINNQSGGF